MEIASVYAVTHSLVVVHNNLTLKERNFSTCEINSITVIRQNVHTLLSVIQCSPINVCVWRIYGTIVAKTG